MSRNIIIAPQEYYHIYNRGNDRRIIFHDEADYDRFIKLMYIMNCRTNFSVSLLKKQGKWETCNEIDRGETLVDIGAWVLMPNHFHILVREKNYLTDGKDEQNEKSGMALFMQKLMTAYSMYYNKKYFRKGTIMESKYKAGHLDSDRYLKYIYTYIHLNPVALVENGWKKRQINNKAETLLFLQKYKYSSYSDYCGQKRFENAIINPVAFPGYFSTVTDFEDMIKEWVGYATNKQSSF